MERIRRKRDKGMKIDKVQYDLFLARKCLSELDVMRLGKVSKTSLTKIHSRKEVRPKVVGRIAKALDTDVENIIEKEGSENT